VTAGTLGVGVGDASGILGGAAGLIVVGTPIFAGVVPVAAGGSVVAGVLGVVAGAGTCATVVTAALGSPLLSAA
jgi:hypothetical protein